jgi:hypothetical protein
VEKTAGQKVTGYGAVALSATAPSAILRVQTKSGAKAMSYAQGYRRPGLRCEYCGEAFALFLARQDVTKVEQLPDPFEATCPVCRVEATYQQLSIGILVAVGDQ